MMTTDDLHRVLTPTLLAWSLSDTAGLVGIGGGNAGGSVDDRVPLITFVPLGRVGGREDLIRRAPRRPVDVRERLAL
jgi:hypothetical protein